MQCSAHDAAASCGSVHTVQNSSAPWQERKRCAPHKHGHVAAGWKGTQGGQRNSAAAHRRAASHPMRRAMEAHAVRGIRFLGQS